MVQALTETKGLIYLAARRLGCRPDTIYTRARGSGKVAECIRHQRGEFVDLAEMKLHEAVSNGDPWAVQMVLKTLGKDRGYVERVETHDVSDAEIDAEVERELARLGAALAAGRAPEATPPPVTEVEPPPPPRPEVVTGPSGAPAGNPWPFG